MASAEADAPVPATLRVAFLTAEYPTERQRTGGIANYVMKMATALTAAGVSVEVFVTSGETAALVHRGVRVQRVARCRDLVTRGLARFLAAVGGPRGDVVLHLANARLLAAALERRDREAPFDVVQSSNYRLTGAFVNRRAGRRHVVRISTSRLLYDPASGVRGAFLSRLTEGLDVRVIRAADLAYAPSRYLADHFNRRYGTDMRVLRPPAELGAVPLAPSPGTLPPRYLVHFGSLSRRKGTEVVAEALVRAWDDEPGLQMVWIGSIAPELLERCRDLWGRGASRVTILEPLDKDALYGVVAGAVASVLPSLVDNLPNTVIESLVLGVPVIGSDGASIDELVEPGGSGALVPIGDAATLALAMVRAWRGGPAWLPGGWRAPAALAEMEPARAVRAFLDLVSGRR